jgi:ATP-dependent helicase/nuclease subunit A
MITEATTAFAGGPPLTEAQSEAVRRDGHTLIAAGAGSGKTTTIVEKIVWTLADAGGTGRACELSEIAAITFTNAAAADFKRKLRRRIREVAEWHAARDEHAQAERWRERTYEVDRARIGTIHSFCGQILREFAFPLGIDPGFAILDDAETAALRADCVAAVVQRAFRDDPRSLALLDHFRISDVERLVAELVARGDVVRDTLAEWFDGGVPRIEQLRGAIERQRVELDCDDDEGVWREVDPGAARLAGTLLTMAESARAQLGQRLDAERALDYDALIARARAALETNAPVLAAVRARLRWLFVDEFQDTDRAQLDVAYLITGFDDWMRRTPPWLCIVGDPKQSIYRFRRADVSLWRAVEEEFVERGTPPIQLDTNFRSRKPIIAYVNATFEGLMGEGHAAVRNAGHEVEYRPLAAHREAPSDTDAVELLAPARAVEGSAEERRDAEAEAIVARILDMRGDDLVWDDEASAFREATWRDVALLFRSRACLPSLERALRRHGVPYYVASSTGFFGRREVRDVRLLLSALADPRDDVAWLGLLRSPFVGLGDASIMRYRVAAPRAALSSIVASDASLADQVLRRAREWLRPARDMRDRVPVADLLAFCVERSAYGAQLLAGEGGRIALGNVRKLIRMAEGRPASTASEFVAFMEEREHAGSDDGDALLFTARDDVVTLSTVHGAKGLEWPIVFLVDVGREIVAKTTVPRIFLDPKAGVGLRITGPESADQHAATSGAWECLRRREQLLSEAEEKRLWYVATTRARDRLVLCASTADVEETLPIWWPDAEHDPTRVAHWLLRALEPQDGYFTYSGRYTAGETLQAPRALPPVALPPLPTMDELAESRGIVLARGDLKLAEFPGAMLLPRRSATELMLLARNPAEYRHRYVIGLRERRITPVTGTPIVSARIMGDILHAALEERLDGDELDAFIEHELVDRTGESAGSPRLRAARARLFELVEQSTTNPAVARLLEAPEMEPELSFTWILRSEGDSHTVMRGAMDLVARIDGHLEIMDFKSHEIAAGQEEQTARDYDVQMQVYAAALASLTGNDPARFSFFFPSTGAEAARALGSRDVSSAVIRVRQLADQARDAHSGVAVPPGMASLVGEASRDSSRATRG